MNITTFSTERPPRKEEMIEIGQSLLAGLSAHLGVRLLTFKEHYVQEGSIVLTFRAAEPVHSALSIGLEGVLLFDVRSGGKPPAIDAELFLFSNGKRVGLQIHQGRSYMQMKYDIASGAWGRGAWELDVPEEWERITEAREKEYADVVRTYDFE